MLVGRRSFPFEMVPFQVTFVRFRGGIFTLTSAPLLDLRSFHLNFYLKQMVGQKSKTNPSNYCDSIDIYIYMCLICVEQHPPSQYTLHPDNPNFITHFSAVHPNDEPNLRFAWGGWNKIKSILPNGCFNGDESPGIESIKNRLKHIQVTPHLYLDENKSPDFHPPKQQEWGDFCISTHHKNDTSRDLRRTFESPRDRWVERLRASWERKWPHYQGNPSCPPSNKGLIRPY